MSQIYKNFGQKIEDYLIFTELGKGGFATVYKAMCRKTNVNVAIKIIDKTTLTQKQSMIDRVRQEVEIHSRLKHPSILELYTYFEDNENVYIVLELAHNGELQKYLKKNGKVMTEVEAANIMQQIVSGLIFLHKQYILHRDLTLSNILLTHDMRIKIADFGLAVQMANADERHVTMCGTPNYISPEIASRASHGPPADVWSIGCMLYTLLIGQPPFDTDYVKSTLTHIVMIEANIPTRLSCEARDLIKQLLKKNPSERITLNSILSHPFMTRFGVKLELSQHNTLGSTDSGFLTMSTTNTQFSTPYQATQLRPFGSLDCIRDHEMKENYMYSSSREESRAQEIYSQLSAHQSGLRTPEPLPTPSHQSGGSYGFKWSENFTPRPLSANNIPTTSTPHDRISVPPINTRRLPPTRHKSKTAVMSILEGGEVVIEFMKYRKRYDEERVTDVFRITNDGLRIVLYQLDNGRGVPVRDSPPEFPTAGAESIFSYENLPPKYWKKYIYAARFIQQVKSKVTKISYYSPKAKCILMETLVDFEMEFYVGGKLIKSSKNGIKTIECPEESHNFMMEHYQQCFKQCLQIEKALAALDSDSSPMFPVMIGTNPKNTSMNAVTGHNFKVLETHTNFMTPKTISFASPSLSSAHNFRTSTPQNVLQQHSDSNGIIRQVNIPDLGSACQLVSGLVEIKYFDGQILTFTPENESNGFTYTRQGFTNCYSFNDEIPEVIKFRLSQIPKVLRHLNQESSSAGFQSSQNKCNFKLFNDNNVKCIR